MSVTLAADRFRTVSWNYLLAFGGENNTVNKLTGGSRLERVRHKDPKLLIEPGRVYRIVALKQGKQLSMTVDGERILEGTDDDREARTPHSLPAERDAFVGRTVELDSLASHLDGAVGDESTRLLTLQGPGGTGKTRLAVKFGWESLSRWPSGTRTVYWWNTCR